MSDKPKNADAIQAAIAQEYRNMKAIPGLEIGLRPELGTYELCHDHYDAGHTESSEHCAVCQRDKRIAELENQLAEAHALIRLAANLMNVSLGEG